jgi:hypothetical protein
MHCSWAIEMTWTSLPSLYSDNPNYAASHTMHTRLMSHMQPLEFLKFQQKHDLYQNTIMWDGRLCYIYIYTYLYGLRKTVDASPLNKSIPYNKYGYTCPKDGLMSAEARSHIYIYIYIYLLLLLHLLTNSKEHTP